MRPHGCKNKNGYKMSEKALAARRAAAKRYANPAVRMQVDAKIAERLKARFQDPHDIRRFTDKAISDALDATEKSDHAATLQSPA